MRGSELIAQFLLHSPFVGHLEMELREIEDDRALLALLPQATASSVPAPWSPTSSADRGAFFSVCERKAPISIGSDGKRHEAEHTAATATGGLEVTHEPGTDRLQPDAHDRDGELLVGRGHDHDRLLQRERA